MTPCDLHADSCNSVQRAQNQTKIAVGMNTVRWNTATSDRKQLTTPEPHGVRHRQLLDHLFNCLANREGLIARRAH